MRAAVKLLAPPLLGRHCGALGMVLSAALILGAAPPARGEGAATPAADTGSAPRPTTEGGVTPVPAGQASQGDSLDYTTLSHVISIDSLRAGSHDPSGMNEYYFTVTIYALLNAAEERNLEWAKRKKITVELGNFGATKIESLAVWKPDEKSRDTKQLKIDGNALRELVARAMNELKVQEGELALQVDVNMYKRNKRYVFFGESQLVAKTSYYPIPPTKFDTPLRTNQSLMIADDKGTAVRIAVHYDKPVAAAKASKPAAETKKP